MATQITSAQFDELVLQAERPVLVDFFATWCGPCKMMAPVIDEIATERAGEIDVYKVDVDECPDIAQRYGIMSIPTLISFKNGEIYKQTLGAQPKPAVLDLLA